MCHYLNYKFAYCLNPVFNSASTHSICIRPCSQAMNENGEVDHSIIGRCNNISVETVRILSGCTWRTQDEYNCDQCSKLGPLPPDDPLFEYLIEQPAGPYGTSSSSGSRLPRLEDMTWYIPSVPMDDSMFGAVDWSGASKKRKRATSNDGLDSAQHTPTAYEAYLQGAEPLSPKSKSNLKSTCRNPVKPKCQSPVSDAPIPTASEAATRPTKHILRRASYPPDSKPPTPIRTLSAPSKLHYHDSPRYPPSPPRTASPDEHQPYKRQKTHHSPTPSPTPLPSTSPPHVHQPSDPEACADTTNPAPSVDCRRMQAHDPTHHTK